MDSQLRALADGTRRQIIKMVWSEERTASEIASNFAISGPAISQHLRVLLNTKLISLRRDGTRRYYRANQVAVTRVQDELAQIWDIGLSDLKRAAEAVEKKRRRR